MRDGLEFKGEVVRGFLFSALPSIAFFAQHLAVFGNGSTARVPRGDVVGLHLRQLKM